MIDSERIKLDGRVNSINGIRYRYSHTQNSISFYGVSFLVDSFPYKRKSIKVTMHGDVNHERPHVHVGDHEASFDVRDGSRIVGKCDNDVQKEVQKWIVKHSDDLVDLWNVIKVGGQRDELVKKIREDK